MNTLVLAIAGVLVVVGIAMIVLSVVLARTPPVPDDSTPVTLPPATGDDIAFIDQPLEVDVASALGHSAPSPADDDPAEAGVS